MFYLEGIRGKEMFREKKKIELEKETGMYNKNSKKVCQVVFLLLVGMFVCVVRGVCVCQRQRARETERHTDRPRDREDDDNGDGEVWEYTPSETERQAPAVSHRAPRSSSSAAERHRAEPQRATRSSSSTVVKLRELPAGIETYAIRQFMTFAAVPVPTITDITILGHWEGAATVYQVLAADRICI